MPWLIPLALGLFLIALHVAADWPRNLPRLAVLLAFLLLISIGAWLRGRKPPAAWYVTEHDDDDDGK